MKKGNFKIIVKGLYLDLQEDAACLKPRVCDRSQQRPVFKSRHFCLIDLNGDVFGFIQKIDPCPGEQTVISLIHSARGQ